MGYNVKMIDRIFLYVVENSQFSGVSASDVAEEFSLSRPSACNYLNELYRMGKINKSKGKQVLYYAANKRDIQPKANIFFDTYGRDAIYLRSIEMAMASVHYPKNGLAMLISGETGVGKTFFARLTYEYAVESGVIAKDSPFITLNCADYYNNPQLVNSILFGYIKGAFTGATTDQIGLVAKAENGYLFLDEAHRLSPEAQEMLFSIIDTGMYRRLGESTSSCKANVRIILATTESLQDTFLGTFLRRIPVVITLPSLRDFGLLQRVHIIEEILKDEITVINKRVFVHIKVIEILIKYPCKGNIGQLKNDIKLIIAHAYMRSLFNVQEDINIDIEDIPYSIKKDLLPILESGLEVNYPREFIQIFTDDDIKKGKGNNLYDMIYGSYYNTSKRESTIEEVNGKIHAENSYIYDYSSKIRDNDEGFISKKNENTKILLTLCLSGYGTANKIASFIEKQFVFHNHLKVISMDCNDFVEMNTRLNEYSGKGDIICIVGSHNPICIDVPFISLESLFFSEGYFIIRDILKNYGVYPISQDMQEPQKNSVSNLFYFIVENFVHQLNCRELTNNVLSVISNIEKSFSLGFTVSQYIILMIHICCMVEKLVFSTGEYKDEGVEFIGEDKKVVEKCLAELSNTYNIHINDLEIKRVLEIIQDFVDEYTN